MELVKFIFSSVWVWLGFVVLLTITINGAVELVRAFKRNRTIEAFRTGDTWNVKIENASNSDVDAAIYAPAAIEIVGNEDGDNEKT